MTGNVRGLRHVAVNAVDGRVGFVEQAFFDDERWTIRYLVLDTTQELGDRRVLISPLAVTACGNGVISVRHTRRQIAESPDIDTEKPVSRQKELEYSRYFLLPPYWLEGGRWGMAALPIEIMAASQPVSGAHDSEDMHLRSSREVIGYRVWAKDGKIGHIEDFLFDDVTWRIRFIEVDTRNWIGGRHVLVPPTWAQSVSWEQRSITIDLPVEAVRTAPEYLGLESLTPEIEQRMHIHYARELD